MAASPLSMSGFELVDTPGSMGRSCLSLDEFDDASPLKQAFCQQMTEEEYENQGAETTQLALKDLIEELERDPSKFKALLQRRRLEELECSGLMSFLKCRFLSKLQGDKYKKSVLSEDDCQGKLDEVKTGMLMAFNYSQQSKGRRFSQRLAARRARQQMLVNDENAPTPSRLHTVPPPPPPPPFACAMVGDARVPPPPPPCPPPVLKPLGDRNIILSSTPCNRPNLKRAGLPRRESMEKLTIHQELLSCSPLKRLKSTRHARSPGGTPQRRKVRFGGSTDSLNWDDPLNSSEPLTQAFMRIMEHKFRNVRTPSPGLDRSPNNLLSPHSFSDASP